MTVHRMTVRADGADVILRCEDCGEGADLNLGRRPAVGYVVEAFADHQKITSTTEQGVPA